MHHIRIRLRIFLALFFAVMVLGTFGFMAIEDISLADAFYFSIRLLIQTADTTSPAAAIIDPNRGNPELCSSSPSVPSAGPT